MKSIIQYILLIYCFCSTISFGQQKIGIVLSGGGAAGLAHIGVLKALEEKGIPIDYITGTSAGALTGAMYASGYSPKEIEAYVLSNEFQLMTKGKLKENQRFYYKEEDQNASLIDLSFNIDTNLLKSLPTNVIRSSYLDFEMMRIFSATSASCKNDFNQLFVPFRCIASDISAKKSIVLSNGNLNEAVRASMTYPFYFSPISIDGKLLFDGGLYNNFPALEICNEFKPDFVIGSNVSSNASAPSENDLLSQVTNMLVYNSNYSIPCDSNILIEPKIEIGTFEFEKVKLAIKAGYDATIALMDSISLKITRRISLEELTAKRTVFKARINTLKITSITNNFDRKKDLSYARKSMIRQLKNEKIDLLKLEKRYFRLDATPQIDFTYPTLTLKPDSTYNLNLNIRKAKDFKLEIGGHFSSRAVNTGYIGLTYKNLGKTAYSAHGEAYFGKFYGSLKTNFNIEIPSTIPVSASAYFVLNRWDYFNNFATFFEEVKPSFLIQNEMYYGVSFKNPITNSTKSTLNFKIFNLEDDYYQNQNFTNKDTSDITYFDGQSVSWEFTSNTLNKKQFANRGHYFHFKINYINGAEKTILGSLSNSNTEIRKNHNWLSLESEIQKFILNLNHFHLGIHAAGAFNTHYLFSNYTATLLTLPNFALLPDAQTFFLKEFRSPQYVGAGLNMVYSIKRNIDFRIDAYIFQPLIMLSEKNDGVPYLGKVDNITSFMGDATLIYHSPIGPVRLTLNYFEKQSNPFYFQLSYGYVIFNKKAIR
ncbi:MAG: patatin-like phospholipase family protein [Crocinitomicaceae bacterium]|nr:patatin-like phospholipase family protein [Crocinitomicaceae bacterium]